MKKCERFMKKFSSSTASICLLGSENFNINSTNGECEDEISYPTPGTNIGLGTRHSYPLGEAKNHLWEDTSLVAFLMLIVE